MPLIADLHLHSKHRRAASRDMEVESLAQWARTKEISLLGTGDFTHPTYFAELQAKLIPAEPGLYRLNKGEQSVRSRSRWRFPTSAGRGSASERSTPPHLTPPSLQPPQMDLF